MKSPDNEDVGQQAGSGSAPAGEQPVHRQPVHHGRGEGESDPLSGLVLIRRILLGIIESVGEGAELVTASVDEALSRFLRQAQRNLVLLFLLLVGGSLVTAGAALFVQRLIRNWPLVLIIFGGVYLVAWLVVSRRRIEGGETK